MSLREVTERWEQDNLSPYAALSARSKGRQRPMEPCQIRTCYQRDIDRIVHTKAFRRLMHKTQVFLEPKGTHLLQEDAWKERFLLQLEEQAVPVKVFAGDPSCRILGTHFFNLERRETEFAADLRRLIDGPPCEA